MTTATAWPGPRSLFDLWHPDGAPARRLVVGGPVPSREPDAEGSVGLAVVAPGCGRAQDSRAWLQSAVDVAASRLQADGVLWVIVPARRHQTARQILNRAALIPLTSVLTLPAWPHTEQMVSLVPGPLGDAAARQLGWSATAARCVGALALPGAGRALLQRVAPGCGLLAARSTSINPLAWLAGLDLQVDGASRRTWSATAAVGPRTDARVAVLMRFPQGAQHPDLAVKRALDDKGCTRVESERTALATLASAARAAGAAIPSPRARLASGLIAADVLPGRCASHVLAHDPGRLGAVTAAVAAWLRRWNAATARIQDADRELLDELLLAPAGRLAEVGTATSDYLAALRELARRLQGGRILLAAAHNDLTMANVLVAADRVGIVDWEAATPAAAPLVDLWYALADGAARARNQSHAEAVTALDGAVPARLIDEARQGLALTADQELLGFHACWLQHAVDELDRGTQDGPFTAVVRVLATTRLRWPARFGSASR